MILSTDSTANLPKKIYEELNIQMIPMQIILNGEVYDDLSADLNPKEYYQKMRQGAAPKTAQINVETAREYFEKLLAQGEDVLHISFSSALSGTTPSIIKLAEELNQNHENKLVIIDSLNAAMGEGLLVLYAHELIKSGKSIEEIAQELNEKKKKVCSFFTVEQLKYLVRGGRLGKLSGIVGSILNIKPVLTVDENGKLVSFKKVISRKKSIAELAHICEERIETGSKIFICHADCESEANELKAMLITSLGVNAEITEITQVIGCHTGPGLIAVFFFGK
mgnify:CR=1 FL=1